ncbi:MAG: MBL fold metallo-hydrolase [Alphaproteobacteria bacterium]|nr:MBL fold metallo-hydrolase [Alphaproteobacteria bacterium]
MTTPHVQTFFDKTTATWTYVVWCGQTKACAVIDTVLDYDLYAGRVSTHSADAVICFIKTQGLILEWILETHIHADHLTAAAYLKEKLGGRTGIGARITEVLRTWQPIFQNEADTPLTGEQFDTLFEDGARFKIGALDATFLSVPGHTPVDGAYVIGESVFVGDAMFMPDVGTGRCDFPGGCATDSYASCQKILALPDQYQMYVGHDYPPADGRGVMAFTTIGTQKKKNIRVHAQVTEDAYVLKRRKDDTEKPVPKMLIPALQVNLRAGSFGPPQNGICYLKVPVNKL